MSNDKKYPLSVAPLYTSGYNLQSVVITPEILEKLGQLEVGGKFVIKTVKEEWRKNEKSPHGYLEYLTPAEVAERRKFAESKSDSI